MNCLNLHVSCLTLLKTVSTRHRNSDSNGELHSIEDELLNKVSECSNNISKEIEAFKMETRKQFSELSKIV